MNTSNHKNTCGSTARHHGPGTITYIVTAILYSIVCVFLVLKLMFILVKSADTPFAPEGLPGSIIFLVRYAGVVNVLVLCIPAYLFIGRCLKDWKHEDGLLPYWFREARRIGYRFGIAWIFLGHTTLIFTCGLIVYYAIVGGGMGMPLGIGIAFVYFMYAVGIVFVEISIRGWKKSNVGARNDG